MERLTLSCDINNSGKRLDAYLAEELKGRLSRSQIKLLIKDGKVSVGGTSKKPHYKISGTEKIEILLPEQKETDIIAENIPLDIIYEDEDIIVVNKSSGMVVHPAEGNPDHTLVNALVFHTKGRLSHIGTSTRPGIVHRLDKEVSGLMVCAKTDSAANALVEGFKKRDIKRRYIAFVKGQIRQPRGEAILPIGRGLRDRKKMAVRFLNSKEAITRFKVLKRFSSYTKMVLELETGRTHQIRVHMSYMGYPIIGDNKYGGSKFKRIALYAAELNFTHPHTKKQLHFSVDIPDELKSLDDGTAAID